MQRLLCLALILKAAQGLAEDPGPAQNASAQRLEEMTVRAKLLRAEFAAMKETSPLTLIEQPILRYSDPARDDTDGTVWLFADGQCPVTILCVFMKSDVTMEWNHEFTSLVDQPIQVTGRPDWKWTPREQTRKWIRVGGEVSEREAARGQQMRAIARQVAASEVFKGEDYQLRLLPRPVHRYADDEAGIIDGALFAFTYGTNPEVFLQTEARREETDKPRWLVSFARSSAAAVTVTRDGMTVWSAAAHEHVGFRSGRLLGLDPRDPYFSVWGPDPLPESP